jgi:DNA-binding response OmpR family regulator
MSKILFIEDQPEFQEQIGKVFKKAGFDFVSASDGESGYDAAVAEKPDLILLDLVLPKRNGFEVLQSLKENADMSKIPVVILTNLEGELDISRALAAGAAVYLVKANYSLSDILAKVETILKK